MRKTLIVQDAIFDWIGVLITTVGNSDAVFLILSGASQMEL